MGGQTRAAIYVRVSTEEQRKYGLSVEQQLDSLRTYADRNDLTIAGVYNDAGISGRKSYKHRPALNSLLDDVADHRIDLVLFTRLDRWFRSVADYYEVQTILDENHVAWRAIDEDYETETSSGIFKVNIMLSVAQAEADRTSEKVSAVVQWRKAQGAYIGRPPLGFTLERDTLKIDPNTEAAVRAFFQTYLSTAGDRRAAVESAATAGVSITPKRANHMLTCHTYTHGYLSEEQFTETCRLNHLHRRKPHASGHIYLFSGLVRCAVCGLHCGGRLTKSGDGAAIPVYTCKGRYSAIHNCSGVNKSEYVIERICLEQLEGAIEERQAELERPSEAERDIDAEIRRIQGKLARLRELYIDGDISREDYSERKQKLEAVMPVSLRRKKSIPLPKLPDDWKQIYNQLDAKHRQAFWAGIIDRIEIKREYGAGVKIFLR